MDGWVEEVHLVLLALASGGAVWVGWRAEELTCRKKGLLFSKYRLATGLVRLRSTVGAGYGLHRVVTLLSPEGFGILALWRRHGSQVYVVG